MDFLSDIGSLFYDIALSMNLETWKGKIAFHGAKEKSPPQQHWLIKAIRLLTIYLRTNFVLIQLWHGQAMGEHRDDVVVCAEKTRIDTELFYGKRRHEKTKTTGSIPTADEFSFIWKIELRRSYFLWGAFVSGVTFCDNFLLVLEVKVGTAYGVIWKKFRSYKTVKRFFKTVPTFIQQKMFQQDFVVAVSLKFWKTLFF